MQQSVFTYNSRTFGTIHPEPIKLPNATKKKL